MNLRYKLIPKKEGIDFKEETIFFWSFILQDTGAGYLFRYGRNTFNANKCIYDGSRTDGSPVSNDGFDVSKEDALVMARLFRGYAYVNGHRGKNGKRSRRKRKSCYNPCLANRPFHLSKSFCKKSKIWQSFANSQKGSTYGRLYKLFRSGQINRIGNDRKVLWKTRTIYRKRFWTVSVS